VKSGYLSFDYNKDPGQADQSFILHIPGTNVIIRTEKATLTFSISILHLLTFSSLQYYHYPTSAKNVKELLPTFSPQQDTKQERAAKLPSTRQVNSDRMDAPLRSWICDPTIAKDPKRPPTTISLSDLQGLQKKLIFKSYSLIT
jgi:hypothetical protein